MDIFSTDAMVGFMSETGLEPTDNAFTRVISGLLRPLVRALIAQGITAPALYRIVKRIYVEVAELEFQLEGERQTDSRISMLTGVHRRDVRSFRDQDLSAEEASREKVTTMASVLGRWLAQSPDGPAPLPRSGENSFETLVRAVSKDIRPRTVLDELERQALVTQQDGMVHLRSDAFLGPADPEQKVHFFAENVGDHISAAVENLLAEEPPFLERAVFYNRLTASSVGEIEKIARNLSEEALLSLNDMAHTRQQQDLDAADGTHRMRFGVFFYSVDEASEKGKVIAGEDDET